MYLRRNIKIKTINLQRLPASSCDRGSSISGISASSARGKKKSRGLLPGTPAAILLMVFNRFDSWKNRSFVYTVIRCIVLGTNLTSTGNALDVH